MGKFRIFGLTIVVVLFSAFLRAENQKDIVVKSVRVVSPFNRNVPWEIDLGESGSCEIKIKDQMGFPIVEIFANGKGPYKFLLDTGADSSIISYELVKLLNLSAKETKKRVFQTANQKAEIDTVLYVIEKMMIGDAMIKDAPFVATNTATDDFQLLKYLDVIGILGANLFHDIILTLDFPQQKFILSQHLEDKLKGHKVKLNNEYYLPVVNIQVDRKEGLSEYHLLVDSGYTGFIKMPICFPYDDHDNQQNTVMSYDIFNQAESGFISELDGTLTFGDKKLENPLVKYSLGNCQRTPKWGLMGTEYLKYQKISIDQRNREVIVH